MKKTSSEGIPCMFCERPAEPGSDPPVCKRHMKELKKEASRVPRTLKELDSLDGEDSSENGANRAE